jgi:hypothetical protein
MRSVRGFGAASTMRWPVVLSSARLTALRRRRIGQAWSAHGGAHTPYVCEPDPPGRYAIAGASPNATPVSSSDRVHSRSAVSVSRAAPLRPTSVGWPRCSWKPSGPS